jgi:hypothetical protein
MGSPPMGSTFPETYAFDKPAIRDGLEAYYAFSLQALGALLHFEFNGLPLVEGLVPVGLNRREVHKDVLTGLALDKSIALGGVEPLHCTLLSTHFFDSYFHS